MEFFMSTPTLLFKTDRFLTADADYIGEVGEITYNADDEELRLHNGIVANGELFVKYPHRETITAFPSVIVNPVHGESVLLKPVFLALPYNGQGTNTESRWVIAADQAMESIIYDTGWSETWLETLDLSNEPTVLTDDTYVFVTVTQRNELGHTSQTSTPIRVYVCASRPENPQILTPTQNAETTLQPTFVASDYQAETVHEASRWIIARNEDLTDIALDSGWSTTHLTTFDLSAEEQFLTDNESYFVSVTYRTVEGFESNAATTVAFLVKDPYPFTPILTGPVDGSTVGVYPILQSSEYIGSAAHGASRWVIATDAEMTAIAIDTGWSSTHLETLDLRAYGQVLSEDVTYYATVTYRSIEDYDSEPSVGISFLSIKMYGVKAWGADNHGQSTVPAEAQSGVIAIAANADYSLALKDTGEVIGWGSNNFGRIDIPAEAQFGVVAIAAGINHALALKDTGEVIGWGHNNHSQSTIPAEAQSGVIAIAAGGYHSLALKDTGAVIGWGRNDYGQITIPAEAQSGVIAIAGGDMHSLALKDTGAVIRWGRGDSDQSTIFAEAQSGVIAIAAGQNHSLALKDTGEVIGWGSDHRGQITIPVEAQSGVIAIAGGGSHSLALKDTGVNRGVIGWGDGSNGQNTIPTEAQAGVIAIAGGRAHSLAYYQL